MNWRKFSTFLRVLAKGLAIAPTMRDASIALEGISKVVEAEDKETVKEGVKDLKRSGVVNGVMGSPVKHLSFEEGREYTRKQALKHIIATEEHFRSKMCTACLLEKHLPALEIYGEEGLSYCVDRECDAYKELIDTVKEAEQELMNGTPPPEKQLELAEKFRRIRKELSGYEGFVERIKERAEEANQVQTEQSGGQDISPEANVGA